ncbi:hypothetical protein A3F02_01895 [Candidatus Curtissbacteria bacterium RIFCSPHIGHO2_12_FULL_38_9b]|uniref:FAD/NAD(P)-binding domain-containing protein n=2 Tax=Candidatus Curtissiibacteriota TaxID=1752717 RepID=A0A1F5GWA3_9BACT|nr:MAG: hypothetical protein A3A48_03915 [Candidatus Curtissbacteria bacterium RIFCSPLOWO2_01_FULL_37_9]OGD96176.1 MAG: hypothetical protein A3F02_01895 [Candidatus Curtissbacteria bacterium RIFCSPHIGHO2_12_FULL_38_9b]
MICLGSEPTYFNIEGLAENSISLKRLSDAVRIKDSIEQLFHQKIIYNKKISIVIGGGGYSGTELAAELTNYRDRLLDNQTNSNSLVQISILEAADRLLCNLDPKISEIAKRKLISYHVNLLFNCMIKKVTNEHIETVSGQRYPYDLLIWTGGIKASSILLKSGFKTNKHGQIRVDDNLKVIGYNDIFAAGDCVEYIMPQTKIPVPSLGQTAKEQGKIAGENIFRLVNDEDFLEYKYKNFGFLIPLRGRYVVAVLNFIHIHGFLAWVIQQLIFLRYLVEILPVYRAIKRWNQFERSLEQD